MAMVSDRGIGAARRMLSKAAGRSRRSAGFQMPRRRRIPDGFRIIAVERSDRLDYYAQKDGVEAHVAIEGNVLPLTPTLRRRMERLVVESWLAQQMLAELPTDTDAHE